MTALQFFLCTALPVTGMCYALIGALKLPLVERLKIDEAKVGGLLSAFGIMFGPVILAAGFLSDSLGRHPPFPRPPVRPIGSFRGLPQKANY